MKEESVHISTYSLSSVDIGADKRAKPSALANALQEAARAHALKLGWGVETLHEKQKYWVLSAIQVSLKARPKHAETLTVQTWPKGIHGIFALRDYVATIDNSEVFRATSSWALLDAKSGRPTSVTDLSELFMERQNVHSIETPAKRIAIPSSFDAEREISPIYTDLDEIGHVNNARYLDWAWSALEPEHRNRISGWTVNYLKEVHEGQNLILNTAFESDRCVCIGIREDNKPAFVVEFQLD
ncbi:MAG: hypothetical protein HWE14_04705 [Flavobacteriia bacterium]|nr:hypothetical protein [Flavobacteriia bacterium]